MYPEANALKQLFDRSHTIVVVSHRSPDGDTLGANLALSMMLEVTGHDVISYCQDPPGPSLLFLPGIQRITTDRTVFSTKPIDLVIGVDAGDLDRLGLRDITAQWSNPRPLVFADIDHHAINDQFGVVNIVDEHAASTTHILYQLFRAWNVRITPDIATALLCGILTDTGSFSNLATTAEAMKSASELMGYGGRMKQVVTHTLQQRSVKSLKLWGRAFSRLKLDPKTGWVTTAITYDDLQEYGASDEDVSGFTNFLISLDTAQALAVYVEQEKGIIRASLRSKREDVDVAKIALQYGGGGHKKAAGFTCQGAVTESPSGWVFKPAQAHVV